MGDLAHSLHTLGYQDWIYLAEQAEKVGAWDLLTLNSLLQSSLQCLPYTRCISITLLIQTLSNSLLQSLFSLQLSSKRNSVLFTTVFLVPKRWYLICNQ